MKTIILLLLAINISLFAQNLEPTQSGFSSMVCKDSVNKNIRAYSGSYES